MAVDLRDARVLSPVAHARADDGAYLLPAEATIYAATATEGRQAGRMIWRVITRFNGRFEQFRGALSRRCSAWRSHHRRFVAVGCRRSSSWSRCVLIPFIGRGLLPAGRRRADSSSTCAHRPAPASRRPSIFARVDADDPRIIPPQRSRAHPRQHRACPTVGINLAIRATRRRSARPTARCSSRSSRSTGVDLGLHQDAAPPLPKNFPGDVLLPVRRHREPDPQLRHARADRRAGRRAATATANYAIAAAARRGRCGHPGRGDVRVQQVVDAPELQLRRGPRRGAAAWADAARTSRRTCSSSLSVERPGGAELLAESGERRAATRRRPDAAVHAIDVDRRRAGRRRRSRVA